MRMYSREGLYYTLWQDYVYENADTGLYLVEELCVWEYGDLTLWQNYAHVTVETVRYFATELCVRECIGCTIPCDATQWIRIQRLYCTLWRNNVYVNVETYYIFW
jgi:hypothetical protein